MSDFNFNEVVIDRVHRIHEYDLNGKRLWTMNQVKDFKLTLGGETVYAQDAQGVNIMAFDKSKTAEADWSNALMHLGALAEQGISIVYDDVHMVLAQGNFVLAVSEGTFGGAPTSYYDLWRVENGKIAEHWDVMETIADQSTWQNQNGKF